MLAAYVARLGGDDPLTNLEVGEQPDPRPGPGWSVVRVEAASLNHHDLFTLRGVSSQPVNPPQILGCDAAGTVDEHGEGAPDGAPAVGSPVVVHSVISCGACAACRSGDELFCRRMALLSEGGHPGTLAERVAVPTVNLLPIPEGMSAVEAACLPTAYLTAYRMLFTRARLRPGDTVLVQGASGGVATAVMVLARATGLVVVATSRDPAKRSFAIEQGAAAATPPDREALDAVRSLTGGRGADAVVETVGEPTWDLSLRCVRPGGTVIVAGATAGANPPAQLNRVFWRQIVIAGSTMGTRSELERLLRMCTASGARPVVDRTFSLRDAPAAFARLAAGEQRGKVVLTTGDLRS